VTLYGSDALTINGRVQKNEQRREALRHTFTSSATGRMEQNVPARSGLPVLIRREKNSAREANKKGARSNPSRAFNVCVGVRLWRLR
jgi:hypothetical protein